MTPEIRSGSLLDDSLGTFPRQRTEAVIDEMLETVIYIRFA
jgi:hypothetical protein